MATYNYSNLPETTDLVELTRQEIYESTDLDDSQKRFLFRAMDFAELLELRLYLCPDYPCLYVTDGEIYSEILGTEFNELETLVGMLEFMCARNDRREGPERIAQLERRVKSLENQLQTLPNGAEGIVGQAE